MAEPSPDKIVIGAIGPLITTVIGAAIGWLPGLSGAIGAPLTVLLAAVGAISGLVFSLMYKRYIGVLGAGGGRKGYPARDAYEGLRASLSGGNLASRLYADWLTRSLDAVDRFFGDAGKADQTLFPRAFGLKTPGVCLGVWLRTIAIRFVATAGYLWSGFWNIPTNFRRTLFVVDLRHPAELVPGYSGHFIGTSAETLREITDAAHILDTLVFWLIYIIFYLLRPRLPLSPQHQINLLALPAARLHCQRAGPRCDARAFRR